MARLSWIKEQGCIVAHVADKQLLVVPTSHFRSFRFQVLRACAENPPEFVCVASGHRGALHEAMEAAERAATLWAAEV